MITYHIASSPFVFALRNNRRTNWSELPSPTVESIAANLLSVIPVLLHSADVCARRVRNHLPQLTVRDLRLLASIIISTVAHCTLSAESLLLSIIICECEALLSAQSAWQYRDWSIRYVRPYAPCELVHATPRLSPLRPNEVVFAVVEFRR